MRWDQERRRAVGLGCERLRSGMQELRYSRALPPASVPAETRHAGSRTVGQLQPARPRDLPTPEWGSPPGFRAARCAGSPGMGQGGARHTGRADRWGDGRQACGLRGSLGMRIARATGRAGREDRPRMRAVRITGTEGMRLAYVGWLPVLAFPGAVASPTVPRVAERQSARAIGALGRCPSAHTFSQGAALDLTDERFRELARLGMEIEKRSAGRWASRTGGPGGGGTPCAGPTPSLRSRSFPANSAPALSGSPSTPRPHRSDLRCVGAWLSAVRSRPSGRCAISQPCGDPSHERPAPRPGRVRNRPFPSSAATRRSDGRQKHPCRLRAGEARP